MAGRAIGAGGDGAQSPYQGGTGPGRDPQPGRGDLTADIGDPGPRDGDASRARTPAPRDHPGPYPDWGAAASALGEFFRTAGIGVRHTGTHQTGVTTFAFDAPLRLPVDEAFFLAEHATRIGFLESPGSIGRFRDEHPGATLCLTMIGIGWDDYYYERPATPGDPETLDRQLRVP